MSLRFADDDFCPCGSTLKVRDCRCAARHFVPPQVNARPRGVITGMRRRGCYASGDRNCWGPLSSEHSFTRSILSDWGTTSTTKHLRDGTKRVVPVASAGANVLCKRHNEALSPLDEVGRRFVAALRAQAQYARSDRTEDTHALFNGFDVERWILKILCGSHHLQPVTRLHESSMWVVPQAWAEIVFGGRPFPPGGGIYFPRIARRRMTTGVLTAVMTGYRRSISSPSLIFFDGDHATSVLGMSIAAYGLDIDLFIYPPEEPDAFWYRIRMLRTRSRGGGYAYIHLGWVEAPPVFAGKVAPIVRDDTPDVLLN